MLIRTWSTHVYSKEFAAQRTSIFITAFSHLRDNSILKPNLPYRSIRGKLWYFVIILILTVTINLHKCISIVIDTFFETSQKCWTPNLISLFLRLRWLDILIHTNRYTRIAKTKRYAIWTNRVAIRVSWNINEMTYIYDLTWRIAHAISHHCTCFITH